MDGIKQLAWVAAKAFAVSVVATPIIRDVFRSYNVVDRPGMRKVHRHPIPRVGGIAIALAYAVSLISLRDIGGSLPDYSSPLWTLVAGAAVVFCIGLIDDFFDLKPVLKIAGEIAAAGIVFYNGVRVETIGGATIPIWLSFVLTLAWLLLTTNALNLIDGLDGLCAGMGLLSTLTLFVAALIYGNFHLAYATLPLAGALAGFLLYNFNPATVFLGDSGALLIGFLLGCYGMLWTQKTATLLSVTVPLLALSIPLLDVSVSVLRRFLRNRPIFSADRGHIHHKLLDLGLSPRRAVLILYLASAVPAGLALMLSSPSLGKYQAYAVLVFCIAAWAGIRQLRYSEFDMAGHLLFGGEFKRTLDARLRLKGLAAALENCADEDQWWEAVVEAARELRWARIRWLGEHSTREQSFSEEQGPTWSFQIPLSATDVVHTEGYLESATPQIDLLGFAAVLARTYSENRQRWGDPVLP